MFLRSKSCLVFFLLALALLFFFIFCFPLPEAKAEPATEIKRKILVFYNPAFVKDLFFTTVHQAAETPLNYLGLTVEYRSLLDPLPDDAFMDSYRGVLTWFTNANEVPFDVRDPFCDWLTHQMNAGRRYVMLEEFGEHEGRGAPLSSACQTMFKTLGASFEGDWADNPYFFEAVFLDHDLLEFERKLSFVEGLVFSLVKPAAPDLKVLLSLRRTDMADSDSVMAFLSGRGGYVHPKYVLYEDRNLDKRHWRLNPFLFFAEAFATTGWPKPDPTTQNGKRLFFSHIDGDGVFNISHIDQKSFSGEVIYDKILKIYKDIPITVSLLTAYFEMQKYQGDRVDALYRNIFSLENVEPASHSYTHPLKWQKEEPGLPGYRFDIQSETTGSVSSINQKLRSLGIEKPVSLFLWTGDCLPSAQQLAYVVQNGLRQMNGGDSRFDHVFDSLAFVLPFGLTREGITQYYASNSNENTYTNLWKGPFFGYRRAYETMRNTGEPRRIKPINVYYHVYVAERLASLLALKQTYDWALEQDVFAIRASEFPLILDDFFQSTIFKTGNGFRVVTAGWLKTVRFDGESRFVDLQASNGVLGFVHALGNLYVSLDEGLEHLIVLTDHPPNRPYVVSASFAIHDFQAGEAVVAFKKNGWHKSRLLLGGCAPGRAYGVTAGGIRFDRQADDRGFLALEFAEAENGGADQMVRIVKKSFPE